MTVGSILDVTVKIIAHHRSEFKLRWWNFIPRQLLKCQVLAVLSLRRRIIETERKNMIMSYFSDGKFRQARRRCSLCAAFGVNNWSIIYCKKIRGASVMMGRGLGRESIGSAGANTSMLAREGGEP